MRVCGECTVAVRSGSEVEPPGGRRPRIQLGVIAQLREDYAEAEQRYQASLTIVEELGDRAGIATSYGQLGMLRTTQGRSGEGIPYTISALVIHLELESPDASFVLYLSWLGRQRQEVGEERFLQILGDLLDADGVRFVIDALNSTQNDGDSD